MKKIIALFVIMLAFGLNANAQQKKTTTAPATAEKSPAAVNDAVEKAAARDLELMSSALSLTEEQKTVYKGLFQTKQRTLATPNLSDERKSVLAENIERKIRSMLTTDQLAKLDANPEVLNKLTH
jgi:hypothetical protein